MYNWALKGTKLSFNQANLLIQYTMYNHRIERTPKSGLFNN